MRRCNICEKETGPDVEEADVRSNVRKFREDLFAVWRCQHCESIHARDDVDLNYYYQHYPFHSLDETKVDWMMRAMYRNLEKRLVQVGVEKSHAILDYGCGSGYLVTSLKLAGFGQVYGYDEYADAFNDPAILDRKYDCVILQDVLEHVPDPWALLEQLELLVVPGGVIWVGTPNAKSIDLNDPEPRIHSLHQPYHRHIFSKQALLDAGEKMGWELLRYYPTMYANTRVPFANASFINHYFRRCDNTMDLILEPIQLTNWRLWWFDTLAHAFFGSFWTPESDVTAVFKRSE